MKIRLEHGPMRAKHETHFPVLWIVYPHVVINSIWDGNLKVFLGHRLRSFSGKNTKGNERADDTGEKRRTR